MSPIENRLAELRGALGGRLPPAVHDARLREARAHLLAAAVEVGEVEAARRFGRAWVVANELVREHRGYGTRSAWSLALPLGAGYCLWGCVQTLFIVIRGLDDLSMRMMHLGWAVGLLVVFVFFARVVQTRRWLAAPMAVSHAAAGVFLTCINHARRPAADWSWIEVSAILFWVAAFGATWYAINALGLGLGRLLDLRGCGARRVR